MRKKKTPKTTNRMALLKVGSAIFAIGVILCSMGVMGFYCGVPEHISDSMTGSKHVPEQSSGSPGSKYEMIVGGLFCLIGLSIASGALFIKS